MNVFDYLASPQPDLFYKRNDPNDPRLGEVVHVDRACYDQAQVVLIGCPQDEGVRRNKGRVGAALAPDEIRRALYRLVALDISLFDAGNTHIQPTLETTHEIHTGIVQRFIQDGKQVISLGGGNDLSYADCRGLAKAVDPVLAINIDAHLDVRADEPRNSGTPYRQLLDEGWVQPPNFYQVGSIPMANSAAYRDYLLGKVAHIVELSSVKEQGLNHILHEILTHKAQTIFWGLDMDVVCAADAPGVSAANPIGLSGYEFCQIGMIAGQDRRTKVFEITEVNPTYDIDARTVKLAAATIHQFLSNLSS